MKVEIIPDSEIHRYHWKNPRCGHKTASSPYSPTELLRKPQLNQCKHGAVVRVDNVPMCRIHAGFTVLLHVVENKGGRV